MDNGPAMKENFAHNLQATGDVYGDPFEVSTMRKEDHEAIKVTKSVDLHDFRLLFCTSGGFLPSGIYAYEFLQEASWRLTVYIHYYHTV